MIVVRGMYTSIFGAVGRSWKAIIDGLAGSFWVSSVRRYDEHVKFVTRSMA